MSENLKTLALRLSERTGLQRRDTLDEFAAQWKSNRDANNIGAPGVVKPYRDHAWVYAAVTAIARNVAQVPFKLWVGETELTETDPLVRLFKRPNPLLSGYELFYSTECYLQLTGNALWVPVPSKLPGVIAELWVFSGKEIKPKIVNNTFMGWTVKRGDMEETFDYEEVVHFRYFNPYNPVLGMAPMEAARLAVDQSWWAQKYNEAFFQNFAEPGVIISFPGDYNAKVMQASRESWDQRHQGFNRAKKTAILWGGAELKELGATKRDMEFIAQMKWGREEVLAVFHVPPVEVMLVDQVSSRVESQRAQRRLFGEEVVAPELKMFEDKLLPLFTMIGRPEVRGWFDTTEVSILQESYGEKIEQAKKLFDMMIPINMIVEKLDLGFEPLAWGDEAFVTNTMIPASKAMLAEAPVKPDDGDGGDGGSDEDEPDGDEPAASDDDEPTEVETGYTLGPRARKLRRVLFEVRNETLKAKDGLGEVDWARVQRRLEPLVCNAPGVTERLKDWSDRASKDQIKIAYSRLKNQVGKLVSPEVAPKLRISSLDYPLKQLPPKRLEFTNEVPDMDGYWRNYETQILLHEQRMESVLVRYFNQWERFALEQWSAQNQGADFDERAPGHYDPDDFKLATAVTPVLTDTMTTMGTCALTMPPVETIPTTHIPMNKGDRALGTKETKALADLLGGRLTNNNHDTDILVGKNAVEVKAITARKNDRVINMSPSAKSAKLDYLTQNGLTGHTVVIDLREGKKLYYYSEGIGSRSLSQMRVVTEVELKTLINVTVKTLPPVGGEIPTLAKVVAPPVPVVKPAVGATKVTEKEMLAAYLRDKVNALRMPSSIMDKIEEGASQMAAKGIDKRLVDKVYFDLKWDPNYRANGYYRYTGMIGFTKSARVSTVVHEYGHAVDLQMDQYRWILDGKKVDQHRLNMAREFEDALHTASHGTGARIGHGRDHGVKNWESLLYVEHKLKGVSAYAHHNDREWFAESWTHYFKGTTSRERLKTLAPGTFQFIDDLVEGRLFK